MNKIKSHDDIMQQRQIIYFATPTGRIDDLAVIDPSDIAAAFAAGKCRAVHRYAASSYLSLAGADWDNRGSDDIPMSAQTWTATLASVDDAIKISGERC